MAKIIPAQPVNADEDGNIISYHLSSTVANDDWIRSARKVKEGKEDELEEANNTKMVRVIPEDDEES